MNVKRLIELLSEFEPQTHVHMIFNHARPTSAPVHGVTPGGDFPGGKPNAIYLVQGEPTDPHQADWAWNDPRR